MDSLIPSKDKPVSGNMQPDNGRDVYLKFTPMGRRKKQIPDSDTPEGIARQNIRARLEVMFPKATGDIEQYELLGKIADVGLETIRTFMRAERNPTLPILVKIATAAQLTMPELFTPPVPSPKPGNATGNRDNGDDSDILQQR